jgi:hypothetical protein
MPEQIIPMRVRRKPCYNGLAQLAKVVYEGDHFGVEYPGMHFVAIRNSFLSILD